MNSKKIEHAPMNQFPVVDDCLQVGGIPITLLSERVGRTPYYAYDRTLLSQRVALLRQHLPVEIHLHYAIKANPMPAVVGHLAPLVDGLDVASAGELKVALAAGTNAEDISFAGPGKSEAELAAAVAAGILVNLESEREMNQIAVVGERLGRQPRVAVRVNPDFELKSSGMKMGGGPKQFGVDAELVPGMLNRIGELGLDFWGFHIFSGSQNLRADSISEAQAKTLDLAAKLARSAPSPVRVVNIGGGFGIPYFPGERPFDVSAVGVKLRQLLDSVDPVLGKARIVIELGRYLVGEAGLYICRVVDRKVSRGQVFLVTDGGLHHHLAASGNFGQIIRKNYPVVVGNKMTARERELASVVGPLCTPLDVLAENVLLARAEVGDLIVVYQSGAYGLTASPTAFLGHPPPAEILV